VLRARLPDAASFADISRYKGLGGNNSVYSLVRPLVRFQAFRSEEETVGKSLKLVTETDFSQVENARVGYQAAIALWIDDEEIAWARFNAMLMAKASL